MVIFLAAAKLSKLGGMVRSRKIQLGASLGRFTVYEPPMYLTE